MQMYTTQLHTIILTVGPSGCGKTHFCKWLISQLADKCTTENFKPNIQYVCSDDIRKNILGCDVSKSSNDIIMSSHHAFKLLYSYVDTVTSFPINAHFVIVDTSGLSKNFRNEIIAISKKNNYHLDVVLFNFTKRQNFYKFSNHAKKTDKQITYLHNTTLAELGNEYTNKYIIKSLTQTHDINVSNLQNYLDTLLPNNCKYLIIGDIHECIDEFKLLVCKVGFSIVDDILLANNTTDIQIILIGDLFDKGNKTRETIDFFYKNFTESKVKIHYIMGNHEHAVYQLLTNPHNKIAVEHYTSYQLLANDTELRDKFLTLMKYTKPTMYFHSQYETTRSFYVTHAPCHNIYLGKIDAKSVRNCRYYPFDRTKNIYENLSKFVDLQSNNYPLHIFGHTAIKNYYCGIPDGNNLVAIDTGAIYGNKLSAILYGSYMSIPKLIEIEFANNQTPMPQILENFCVNTNNTNKSSKLLENLDAKQQTRIKSLAKNNVNFISGTMCPASVNGIILESLEAGLEYYYNIFKSKNTNVKLSLQPKYMGSRCNVYLTQNIAECYMTSRNGYLITDLNASVCESIYTKLLSKFNDYIQTREIKMLIIDCELMPWSAIGRGLIEDTFKCTSICLESELQLLNDTGFESHYNNCISNAKFKEFCVDKLSMCKKSLCDKYSGSLYQTFNELSKEISEHVSLNDYINYCTIYNRQLQYYAQDSEIHVKPFNLLKIIYIDGSEEIPALKCSQIDTFYLVSDDNQMVIDFAQGFNEAVIQATDYFNLMTTNNHMEGIVIKPEFISTNVAPYIKVRNPDYLTLIYGADYLKNSKYQKLISQKSIVKKLKISINEFNLGLQMLQIKYNEIDIQNTEYIKLLIKFLFEIDNEKELDPRL